MGILDNKSRWMDIHLTPIGRLQLAGGNFNIRYWSISDKSCAYLKGGSAADGEWLNSPDAHLMLETWDKPQDKLTMFTNDYGEISNEEFIVQSDDEDLIIAARRASAELSRDNIQKIINNWDDDLDDIASVKISAPQKDFSIFSEEEIDDNDFRLNTIEYSEIDELWECKEASNKLQFRYLPPVNTNGDELGEYNSLSNVYNNFDFESLESKAPIATWDFLDQKFTTQFYIIDSQNNIIKPLTIISRGSVIHENTMKDIYSIGELIQVDGSSPKYVNIFTLVVS